MRIDVLTLFPEVCEPFFSASILGRARQSGLVTIACHNIRGWSADPHHKVDDRPFGGGPGMVMTCQPVFEAVEGLESQGEGAATRVLLTPQGERLNQRIVEEFAARERLILIAGHYEGFDERIRSGLSPREISIGDYVLSGGEAAAMVLVDAVVRLIPGALGDEESVQDESFRMTDAAPREAGAAGEDEGGGRLLEYPQYTRPRVFRGMEVPEVLLGGDHAKIRAWRRTEALKRTTQRRPDLLAADPDGAESNRQARQNEAGVENSHAEQNH
jgi:tRNA (guanine37-N1)-methyltransferase